MSDTAMSIYGQGLRYRYLSIELDVARLLWIAQYAVICGRANDRRLYWCRHKCFIAHHYAYVTGLRVPEYITAVSSYIDSTM